MSFNPHSNLVRQAILFNFIDEKTEVKRDKLTSLSLESPTSSLAPELTLHDYPIVSQNVVCTKYVYSNHFRCIQQTDIPHPSWAESESLRIGSRNCWDCIQVFNIRLTFENQYTILNTCMLTQICECKCMPMHASTWKHNHQHIIYYLIVVQDQ